MVCTNVSTWSNNSAYLETGLLPALYPPPGGLVPVPPDTGSPNRSDYTAIKVVDTREGQAAVALTVLGGLAILGGMALHVFL